MANAYGVSGFGFRVSGLLKYIPRVENFLLYAAVFSLPLQAVLKLPHTSLTLTKAAGALLILSTITRRLGSGQGPFARTGLGTAILAFAAACGLSLLWSDDRATSFQAFLTLVQYALVFYAVADVSSRDRVRDRISSVYVLAAAVSGVGAVLALSGHVVTPTVDTVTYHTGLRRVCFGLLDPVEQSMLLLFALAFLLFDQQLWRDTAWSRRLLWAIEICAVMAGIALTMSRAAWLCAAALVILRALTGRRRALYGGALLAAAILAATILACAKPDVLDVFKRRMLEGVTSADSSIASRVAHNTIVVNLATHGGLFGHGLATLDKLSRTTFLDPLGNKITVVVHNVPLVLWYDTGWVGLLCYLWLWSSVAALLYTGYRRASTEPSRGRIASYAAIAAIYAAFSLVTPLIYRSGLAVLLGCAVGALDGEGDGRES